MPPNILCISLTPRASAKSSVHHLLVWSPCGPVVQKNAVWDGALGCGLIPIATHFPHQPILDEAHILIDVLHEMLWLPFSHGQSSSELVTHKVRKIQILTKLLHIRPADRGVDAIMQYLVEVLWQHVPPNLAAWVAAQAQGPQLTVDDLQATHQRVGPKQFEDS